MKKKGAKSKKEKERKRKDEEGKDRDVAVGFTNIQAQPSIISSTRQVSVRF